MQSSCLFVWIFITFFKGFIRTFEKIRKNLVSTDYLSVNSSYISHPDYFFDKVENSFPTQRLYNHTLNDVYRIHVAEITSYFKKTV